MLVPKRKTTSFKMTTWQARNVKIETASILTNVNGIITSIQLVFSATFMAGYVYQGSRYTTLCYIKIAGYTG